MDKRPEFPFVPSQHGEPCPHEGDETARYATLLDDVLMLVGALIASVVSLALLAVGVAWAYDWAKGLL